MRIQWSLLAGLFFALITAIFAVINVNPVQVNLLFGTFDVPLILLILGCTLLGAIIVGSYSIYLQYKSQKKLKGLEQQLAQVMDATGYVIPDTVEEPALQGTEDLSDTSNASADRKHAE
ncbi:lipopolysaccharide assembly protein LapA domain-containing protein [Paenibacillus profundus]|uniref:Lipopolysaccharide assembly protein LapA domain-containing protein n=1 Tax=Paenibacillus profundus TaxID=1173085 RepID=A0ABS8YHL1_9BACL|nr:MULTISPECIES: lipopolysaccharide assembly protein LapA domain-containing protein [Paenibacillus]MCE5171062.1 lipopolysaccharide assembly protein LapA domain-containing protein [Paenibacillus profundus]MCM3340411.1 lipopolysaccharide assembly protein LapA domain-containing protein [Paenibacillus sp. MER TA 81-3]